MILIGERINAGFKEIKDAIINKDGDVIKQAARRQADAKANYIDVNLGTLSNKPEDLCWMIEMVQAEVDVPISIDNSKPAMIKEAIKVCKKPPLINSTTAEEARLNELLPIAVEYQASIIGLVMDEAGSPKTLEKRIENAGKIFIKASEYGLPPEHLFVDPIVMPIKYMQDQAKEILSAANQFQHFSDPPCHIIAGLSNVAAYGNRLLHGDGFTHFHCTGKRFPDFACCLADQNQVFDTFAHEGLQDCEVSCFIFPSRDKNNIARKCFERFGCGINICCF